MRCTKCGSPLPENARFCPNCRTEVAMRFCPQCGKPLGQQGSFCPHCGTPLREPEHAPERKTIPLSWIVIGVAAVIVVILLVLTLTKPKQTPIKTPERTQQSQSMQQPKPDESQQSAAILPEEDDEPEDKPEEKPAQTEPENKPEEKPDRNQRAQLCAAYQAEIDRLIEKDVAADDDLNQHEINDRTIKRYETWDDLLNRIYQRIRDGLSESERNTLRDLEKEWIKERDAQAEEDASDWEGGSGYPMAYYGSLCRTTAERCQWLVDEYLDVE